MEKILTSNEKTERLVVHASRLKVFAEKLGERGRGMIEAEAYAILEVFMPRPLAILRYARRGFKQWRLSKWITLEVNARIWWYQRVKGLETEAAINLACAAVGARNGAKAFPTQKGGA